MKHLKRADPRFSCLNRKPTHDRRTDRLMMKASTALD